MIIDLKTKWQSEVGPALPTADTTPWADLSRWPIRSRWPILAKVVICKIKTVLNLQNLLDIFHLLKQKTIINIYLQSETVVTKRRHGLQ